MRNGDLRDLARAIQDVAENHVCYCVAVPYVSNLVDCLQMLARLHEQNQQIEQLQNKPKNNT